VQGYGGSGRTILGGLACTLWHLGLALHILGLAVSHINIMGSTHMHCISGQGTWDMGHGPWDARSLVCGQTG